MKVREMMLLVESNKSKIKELEEQNKELQNKIMKKMESKEKKKYMFEDNDSILKATIVKRNNIIFNIEKLKEKLNMNMFKQVIEKQLKVDEYALEELITKDKNLKKAIKPSIHYDYKVDEIKLYDLIANGQIEKEDIEGTYESKVIKYLKLERKYEEDGEEK